MENKLFLELLSFYLPHQLKFKFVEGGVGTLLSINMKTESGRLIDNEDDQWVIDLKNNTIKPILRPLSDFVKNLDKWEHIRDEFSDLSYDHFINCFFLFGINENSADRLEYGQLKLFLKNHFDVFGLIDNGLAIDMNTIKNNNETN